MTPGPVKIHVRLQGSYINGSPIELVVRAFHILDFSREMLSFPDLVSLGSRCYALDGDADAADATNDAHEPYVHLPHDDAADGSSACRHAAHECSGAFFLPL